MISGIGAMVVYILRIIESTYTVGDILLWVLKILPSYCLNNAIVFAAGKGALVVLRPEVDSDDFSLQNMGGDILISCVHFSLWTILLIIIETGIFRCLTKFSFRNQHVEPYYKDIMIDDTVREEEDRVKKTSPKKMNVRVQDFRKVYSTLFGKPYLAVDKVSFGLDYGECFCLLGVNGAGKTTTFKSLTNDIEPTSGEITINGLNVKKDFNKVRKLIGYCP